MDLAELVAFLVQVGSGAYGSVVLLPVESGGTNWEQVVVQVGGAAAATLTAGGLAVWWARRNHKDALAHDRAMRAKDDVRELLMETMATVKQTEDAIDGLARGYPRMRIWERDEIRQSDWIPDDGRERGAPDDHQERLAEIRATNALSDEAGTELSSRIQQLALFIDADTPPLRELVALQREFIAATRAFSDPVLDADGNFVAGPEYVAHRAARTEALADVVSAKLEFGAAAAAYVKADRT